MLFRMGPDASAIRRSLETAERVLAPECRGSVGISLDEPVPQRTVQGATRIYAFAPRAWTPALAGRASTLSGVDRVVRR
jgi:hypothetical protein